MTYKPDLLMHEDQTIRSAAMGAFLERYLVELQSIARKAVATVSPRAGLDWNDLFQDVCASLLHRAEKGPLNLHNGLGYFKCCCANRIRNQKRRKQMSQLTDAESEGCSVPGKSGLDLQDLIDKLDPSDRDMLDRVLQELKHGQDLNDALHRAGCDQRRWRHLLRRVRLVTRSLSGEVRLELLKCQSAFCFAMKPRDSWPEARRSSLEASGCSGFFRWLCVSVLHWRLWTNGGADSKIDTIELEKILKV